MQRIYEIRDRLQVLELKMQQLLDGGYPVDVKALKALVDEINYLKDIEAITLTRYRAIGAGELED